MVQCGNHSMVESVVTQKLYSHLVCCISPWWDPMGEIRWLHPTVENWSETKTSILGIAGIYEAICETRSFFSTWIQVILSNFLKFGFWHPNLSQFCDGKIHGKITMVQSPCARQTATHLLLVKSERQGQIPLDHGRARFLLKWVFILVVSQWSFILMSIIFHLYALII